MTRKTLAALAPRRRHRARTRRLRGPGGRTGRRRPRRRSSRRPTCTATREAVGGDLVDVTSIITSGSQDPHSYEPSARDQLSVSRADLVIENGGGYDAFVDALLESSGSDARRPHRRRVLARLAGQRRPRRPRGRRARHRRRARDRRRTPARRARGHDHVEGFNEHVWYDPHTMSDARRGDRRTSSASSTPANAADVSRTNAAALIGELEGLETGLADLATAARGRPDLRHRARAAVPDRGGRTGRTSRPTPSAKPSRRGRTSRRRRCSRRSAPAAAATCAS